MGRLCDDFLNKHKRLIIEEFVAGLPYTLPECFSGLGSLNLFFILSRCDSPLVRRDDPRDKSRENDFKSQSGCEWAHKRKIKTALMIAARSLRSDFN